MRHLVPLVGLVGLLSLVIYGYEMKFMRSSITIGTCLRMERTEAAVYDSSVIRKVVGIYADHYETHSYIDGTWDTSVDFTSSVSFHAIPYMEVVTCPNP